MENKVRYPPNLHGYSTSSEHLTKCIDVVKIANKHHFYLDNHHFQVLYPLSNKV